MLAIIFIFKVFIAHFHYSLEIQITKLGVIFSGIVYFSVSKYIINFLYCMRKLINETFCRREQLRGIN